MYCPQCGAANEDSARFCSTCGLDMEEYKKTWQQPAGGAAGQPPAPEPQPQTMGQQSYGPPPYQQQYQQPYQTQQYYQPTQRYGPCPAFPAIWSGPF
jgi:hypothetical protein